MHTERIVDTGRRGFLKASAAISVVAGSGLTLGVWFREACAQGAAPTPTLDPRAFVRIGRDNSVTVIAKHLEMGQGTYTGLATIVAEELDASWDQVKVEGAPADASRVRTAPRSSTTNAGCAFVAGRKSGSTPRWTATARPANHAPPRPARAAVTAESMPPLR